ncbi:MAG: RNA polymerase-associated protein RapA [Porticoccaceae bacterium]|nr:RNA polymerase-associated protein RapA [Porticoccaceae bacterium]
MSSSEFSSGQRWVSTTEPALGLGVVIELTRRQVEMRFPAASETRIYATDNAPLARVIYPSGERIATADGEEITVSETREQNGCVIYMGLDEAGTELAFHEMELDSFVHFSQPRDRLLTGSIDKPNRYRLRLETLEHLHRQRQSSAFGLQGGRVQLLPHQLYIASQVGNRHAPRVLLADEVGLGKTIEAGLIAHQQLFSGRAQRILLVVPESLVHQWLVEMLRRFNLHFSILDAARCEALEEPDEVDELAGDELADDFDDVVEDEGVEDGDSDVEEGEDVFAGMDIQIETDTDTNNDTGADTATGAINPFEAAQLVLCSLDFLSDNPKRHRQALAAGWDLMVVDEAHHLAWDENEGSAEYRAVEALARQTRGLLLLTATPEQLGMAGHFARLRLLDPDRYYSLQAFREEESGYQAVNQVVQSLLAEDALQQFNSDPALVAGVADYLGEDAVAALRLALSDDDAEAFAVASAEVVASLLDRHGTGRVLFRNTRQGIAGFPERHLHTYPLPAPAAALKFAADIPVENLLQAEQLLGDSWLDDDPRVPWLVEWLEQHKEEKALLICARAATARQLEEHLRLREGLRTAVFHEGMNLLERDRAAAYFADERNSAQVLICSEIGSEGRNFQFAHHLVLFDLPLNPDLLEQRIGRLDRIGQRASVELHAPYYEGSAQAVMLDWYHRGLNAFEEVCPAGSAVAEQVAEELSDCLHQPSDTKAIEKVIAHTQGLIAEARRTLEAGRDKLVELNSCNVDVAAELVADIADSSLGGELATYITQVFDEYGVEHGEHSANTIIAEPGQHMHGHSFPGLPEDGMTATFSRSKALTRDDLHFFTWEHPLVAGAMDQIANTDFGSATVCSIKLPPLKPGTLILEAMFVPVLAAPAELRLQRYLPEALVRLVTDSNGNELTGIVTKLHLDKLGKRVPSTTAREIVKYAREPILELTARVENLSKPLLGGIIEQARANMLAEQNGELERLEALAQVNPNIRRDEIDYLKQVIEVSEDYLDRAKLRCDALRLAIVDE